MSNANQWTTTSKAAAQLGRCPATVRRWCETVPGFGRKLVGRWVVSTSALNKLLGLLDEKENA